MTKYPPEILRLLHVQGFNDAFDEALSQHETQEKAYYAVEDLHIDKFGFSRYCDFVSFRANRHRFLSKRRRERNAK